MSVNENIKNSSSINKRVKELSTLNCLYTNIRSLANNYKREEMLAVIEEHKIDIIGITESWSHDGILDSEICFDSFNLFRRDRTDGRKGGGVMLFVRDNIPAVNVTDNVIGNNESVWVKIGFNDNVEMRIGVCYRSPNI